MPQLLIRQMLLMPLTPFACCLSRRHAAFYLLPFFRYAHWYICRAAAVMFIAAHMPP